MSIDRSGRQAVDVIVIGAGQSGLSAAYHLRRSGLVPFEEYAVLDGAPEPGGAWQHRWPTLTYARVHGVHDLPGRPMPPTPDDARASEAMSAYFADYERHFELPVLRPARVQAVSDLDGDRLRVESSTGEWTARAVINATGTWERPFWPYYPGRETFVGRQLHTADYAGPEEFAGQRVIVVGGGTSAVQLLLEISAVATTTWVTRRPPTFRFARFTPEYGRSVVARVAERVEAGRPPESVVRQTALPVTPEVQTGLDAGVLRRRPMFARVRPDGVAWEDGTEQRADAIIWATGFRSVLDHLAPLGIRERGGGVLVDDTRVLKEPRLQLVGYGPSASTIGATRAGRSAVREVRRLLGRDLPAPALV